MFQVNLAWCSTSCAQNFFLISSLCLFDMVLGCTSSVTGALRVDHCWPMGQTAEHEPFPSHVVLFYFTSRDSVWMENPSVTCFKWHGLLLNVWLSRKPGYVKYCALDSFPLVHVCVPWMYDIDIYLPQPLWDTTLTAHLQIWSVFGFITIRFAAA